MLTIANVARPVPALPMTPFRLVAALFTVLAAQTLTSQAQAARVGTQPPALQQRAGAAL